jgi:uncharacterized membrane protein YgcG
MGLINIQRTNNESNPANNKASPYVAPQVAYFDWKVLLVVFFSLFVFWLTALFIANYQCSSLFMAVCYPFYVVFYIPVFIMIIFLAALSFGIAVEQWNKARKSRLANMLYEHYDVADAGKVLELSARVAEQVARSEHLRGLDNMTYSSTNSGGNSSSNSTPQVQVNPLRGIPINIEDIFNHKDS